MGSVKELCEIGEKYGYAGKDLQAFVQQAQAQAREDREAVRVAQAEAAENMAREMALKTKLGTLETEKLREENRKLELECKKLEIERDRNAGGEEVKEEDTDDPGSVHSSSSRENRNPRRGPKMPAFEEGKDDMDSYLHRFERYATVHKWQKADWALFLSALLKGKALDVYSRLAGDDAENYDILKDALLKRFELTEEGFKQRFRSVRLEKGESPRQFMARLEAYLTRWIDLAKVEQTFEGLRNMMVREQYLDTCPRDLAVFLKERKIKEVEELARVAEQYLEAHTVRQMEPHKPKLRVEFPKAEFRKETLSKEAKKERQVKGQCFICAKVGHLARNCPNGRTTAGLETEGYGFGSGQELAGMEREDSSYARYKPEGFGKRWSRSYGNQQSKGFNDQKDDRIERCRQHKRTKCSECNEIVEKVVHEAHCNVTVADHIELKCGCKIPVITDACEGASRSRMPVVEGMIGEHKGTVLRDTGCSTVVVRRSLIADELLTGGEETCILIDGTVRRTPVAMISVNTPYFVGTVKAVCMRNPLYDLIIGNVPGARDKAQYDSNGEEETTELVLENQSNGKSFESNEDSEQISVDEEEEIQAVVTRQQEKANQPVKKLRVADSVDIGITKESLIHLQKEDVNLKKIWESIQQQPQPETARYSVRKQILYRRSELKTGQEIWQVVVPSSLREKVLRLAHDSILSGHQGVCRTRNRIETSFWWPGISGDVTRFVRSCDKCQRCVAKGRPAKIPLVSMPIIDTPFQRVAIDLIGPMQPASDRGARFALTLVDYATRYPEAVPLKDEKAETVAEALVGIFSRVGVPREILSDQGPQLMSGIMKEVSRLLSVKQLVTTPYHPMCTGLVERFNKTLKTMIVKMCSERPKDWDRYINPLLFAYREVPQESLGYSPFELLYGRTVRGPMAILRELWTREEIEPEVKSTYQYVLELKERLQDTCELAHKCLRDTQIKQSKYYNRKARSRSFKPGEKVLILLVTDHNKLLMHWKGPFTVLERVGQCDYKIQLPTRVRLFHANLLKRYFERDERPTTTSEQVGAALIEPEDSEESLVLFSSKQCEGYQNVVISDGLTVEQRQDVEKLIYEFRDIFTDVPKVTKLGEHSIQLTTDEPIRSKAYTLPHAMRTKVEEEIDDMLRLSIIEPSSAAYASPIVIARKPDDSIRICVDYRKLNKVTIFDPEPIPNAEHIFAKLSGDVWFSKFDFSKGYWQIPMREGDRDMTTFVSHRGLYRFKVMPFGLVNAPATFSRIMRKLLDGTQGLDNYLDDVLAHTSEWTAHMEALTELFNRVRTANLTLKPSKCEIGFKNMKFLGHRVGENGLKPSLDTVEKILDAPRPQTKTQLRSFMGLVGYYRKFVPNFAALSSPLTQLTAARQPNVLEWGNPQENAFQALKQHVARPPVLMAPQFDSPFILQTDASDLGIGAVLLQEGKDGMKHPIGFASKKLLPRETRYSTIERECYAIIWGIQKFQEFLYGKPFFLETDHQPLQYLGRAQFQNGRLMRWALALQPYCFTIRAIRGADNVGADYLSRCAQAPET